MLLRFNLSKKGLLLVAGPLAFELAFVFTLSYLLYASDREAERQARAKQIASTANSIERLFFDGVTTLFVYTFNKDDVIGQRCEKIVESIKSQLLELKRLGAQHASLNKKFASVQKAADKAMALIVEAKESLDEGGRKLGQMRGLERRQRVQECTRDIVHELSDYLEEAVRLEKYEPKKIIAIRKQISWMLLFGVVSSVTMAIYIAVFFSRDISRRVLTVRENAKRLAEGIELIPPVGGADEIKELDEVFRTMAESLKKAQDALHESELRMKNILDTAPQGLILATDTGKIEYGNQSARKMLQSNEDSIAALDEFLYETDKRVSNIQAFFQNTELKEHEYNIRRSDESKFPALIMTRPFQQADKTLKLVALNDISEQKRIEAVKQEFVAMLTHDLRSPLTALQFFLASLHKELQENGSSESDVQKRLKTSQQSLTRLIGLINDLLDLDKLQEGKMEIHCKEFFLNDVLADSVQMVAPLLEAKQLSIEIADSDAEINGDEEKVSRLITNLISNAIKFSPNSKKITIEIEEAQAGFVKVHIIDQGPGISKDDQDKIFERFFQSAEGLKTHGTGLGLSICQAIVQAHNGAIGVTSEPGNGADFWFTLPTV